MDEFRKPFEYEEEKRGAILFFVILLISVEIFLAISFTFQLYINLKHIPVLGIISIVIGILYTFCIPYTAMTCYKMKKNLVSVSKAYLVVRAIFTTCSILIVFIHAINDESMIGNGPRQYRNVGDLTFTIMIAPLIYVLVFSAGWYLYFLKSKRCREIVNKSANA